MDLRNGSITLGEILKHPGARTLVEREFPGLLRHPLAGSFMGMTLNRALALLGGRIPRERIKTLLEALKAL